MPTIRQDETKCYKGLHDWVPENIYEDKNGKKTCKGCRADRKKKPESEVHKVNSEHCRRGHKYTPENTVKSVKVRNGVRKVERHCRRCQEDSRRTVRR